MSKFKIGDKVKILSTSAVDGLSNHGVRVGKNRLASYCLLS